MLFSFWRVPNSSRIGDCAFLNTSFPCFFFLACAGALFHRQLRLSAHVISLLFLSGVCRRSLSSATTPFRTRHFLAFSFWRVQALSFVGDCVSRHTSFPYFPFFGVCRCSLDPANAPLRTRLFLTFPSPTCAGHLSNRRTPLSAQTSPYTIIQGSFSQGTISMKFVPARKTTLIP